MDIYDAHLPFFAGGDNAGQLRVVGLLPGPDPGQGI